MQNTNAASIGSTGSPAVTKLKLDARELVHDIHSGMNDFSLMQKYALSAKGSKGRLRWNSKSGAPVYLSLVVADGVIYFGSNDGNFYVLD